MDTLSRSLLTIALSVALATSACTSSHHSRPTIDKVDSTVGGTLLGAAWGAGAGAIVGHQISYAGEGAAVGAGFGAVQGMAVGLGFDATQDTLYDQEQELALLQRENGINRQLLKELQGRMEVPSHEARGPAVYQVYFDPDVTSLSTGSISLLETVAEQIKESPHLRKIVVEGHSDDEGTPKYSERIAEARARSVEAYLASRGVSLDRIEVKSHGSKRPVVSNATAAGRQFNRRVEVKLLLRD